MGRPDRPHDAAVRGFFTTLKAERFAGVTPATAPGPAGFPFARLETFRNPVRLHRGLDHRSPRESAHAPSAPKPDGPNFRPNQTPAALSLLSGIYHIPIKAPTPKRYVLRPSRAHRRW